MASRILRVPGAIVVRLYALLIMFLVIWAGYTAVAYLFRSVFRPVYVPKRFLDWQGHLEAAALRAENISGVTGPAARAPVSHFHTVERWFQPESYNGCTTAGCHSPLPHRKHKATRAFANLHSTFLECVTCHSAPAGAAEPAMWVDIDTGRPQDVPAILQLIRLLELRGEEIKASPAPFAPTLLDLLAQSIEAAGGDPLLEYLLIEMRASEPGSPVWRHAIGQLTDALPSRARGEYGAKIGPQAGDEDLRRDMKLLTEQTQTYLAAAPGAPDREQMYQKIHGSVVAKPQGCVTCHGGTPMRLDFEKLGYSPARVAALRSNVTARLMQDIQEGRPFRLPEILERDHAR